MTRTHPFALAPGLAVLVLVLAGPALASPCDRQPLAQTYATMLKDDQALRGRYIEILRAEHRGEHVDAKEKDRLEATIYDTDTRDQEKLDHLIQACGWPGLLDRKRAAFAAFIIIQHAPLAYQLKHYDLVAAASRRGVIPRDKFAWLVDRVLVEQGKPQLYGTEFDYGSGDVPVIADPAHLDERRRSMGLPPMDHARHP